MTISYIALAGGVELVPVTVVDISSFESDPSSGSGDIFEPYFITPFMSSRALITDFNEVSETPGQLYAYRVSNTSVVLATRSAASIEGDIEFAIGLSSTAEGRYLCQVVNFANGTTESAMTIEVLESKPSCFFKRHFESSF